MAKIKINANKSTPKQLTKAEILSSTSKDKIISVKGERTHTITTKYDKLPNKPVKKPSNSSSIKISTNIYSSSKSIPDSTVGVGASKVKKPVSTSTNLTAKQIKLWGTRIDTAISKKLIPSLSRAYDDAIQLGRVTENGEDSDNLNYRFKDLAQITDQAMKQLTTFLNSFDTNLTTYISTIEKAEKTTAEKLKKSIDQFAEAASKISKLKM